MRHFLLIITFFALFPLLSSAQCRIGYSYDAAGNRIKREIIMPATPKGINKKTSDTQEQMFSESLNKHSVKIYPNPTKGLLKVSISGLKSTDKCSLGVFTMTGVKVMSCNTNTDNVDIDLSNRPVGVYLLKITINNNSTTWKIIKE